MNSTLPKEVAQKIPVTETLVAVAKKVLLFSNQIVAWIVQKLGGAGIPLHDWQVGIMLFIIDAAFLYIVVKYVAKPVLRLAIIILLVWFMIGFFVPT